MGSLYQRGNVWWAKFYQDGRAIRRSCTTTKVKVAENLLKDWEGKVVRGEILPSTQLRFEDLIAGVRSDYKTNGKRSLAWVERRVKHLKPFFGGRRASTISTPDVRAYIEKRQGEGAASGTINRELAVLKRAFNLALQASLLGRRPHIPSLKERNARQGFVGQIEALGFREALDPRLRPLFDFLHETGWRKGEALKLTWDRVDLTAGTVRHDPGQNKTEDGSLIYLTQGLLETLRELRRTALAKGYGTRHVFTRDGEPIRTIQVAWAKARKAAGLDKLVPHDLRRSAVRNLVRAGVPERVAMTISGHKTRAVFDRYNIVSEEDKAQAARKLEQATAAASL